MRKIVGVFVEQQFDTRKLGGEQKLFETVHIPELFLRFGRTALHKMQQHKRNRPNGKRDPYQPRVIV